MFVLMKFSWKEIAIEKSTCVSINPLTVETQLQNQCLVESNRRKAMNIGPTTKSSSVDSLSTTSVPMATVRNGIPPISIRPMTITPSRVDEDGSNIDSLLHIFTITFKKPLSMASIAFI
ncbi:hypothetical protein D9M70_613500 [compost metagenome]